MSGGPADSNPGFHTGSDPDFNPELNGRPHHHHHHHGEAVKVKVRRRRRRSPLFRHLALPSLELATALGQFARRWPAVPAAAGVLAVWWFWPWIGNTVPGLANSATRGPDEVITTFVEDPQRTIGAITLWRERPGSVLVLQGRTSSQAENRTYLVSQGRWPSDERGMVALTAGCDTVGQLAALERWLRLRRTPGRLTVVTSPAHLGRAMAIARILIGSRGWHVEGVSVITGDNQPESELRSLRDQGRAQLLRAVGWDPAAEAVCQVRDPYAS
ncbi:YdcF family protein [Cyanobium sp. FGCU-6]|jgi:uncharacterized SAM-binding protein YcdF (DUF218 family)|nr:YdcF family protein [Cyanobium sp. FGCU6]